MARYAKCDPGGGGGSKVEGRPAPALASPGPWCLLHGVVWSARRTVRRWCFLVHGGRDAWRFTARGVGSPEGSTMVRADEVDTVVQKQKVCARVGHMGEN